MRIRFLGDVVDAALGRRWQAGEVAEVPEAEARYWVAQGRAVAEVEGSTANNALLPDEVEAKVAAAAEAEPVRARRGRRG